MLYLVQHGEAMAKEQDPERPLTERGEADAHHLGAFLARALIPVDGIWESGKLRARQTADILSEHLTPGLAPETAEGLGATDPVEPIADQLRGAGGRILVVSHMPLVGAVAARLVAGVDERPPAAFRPGTALALEWSGEEGWQVAWMIRPELLR